MSSPRLVLQMQRMGDLILTFPLLLDLARAEDAPIWIVAEEAFFRPLLHLSPKATFFPPSSLSDLTKERFSLAINVSSRPEAAEAMGRIKACAKFGPYREQNETYVSGFWQLYRYSLVQNNRHNTMHWADLNRLDSLPSAGPVYRKITGRPGRRIGLVLGASEQAKHPDLAFWTLLTRSLLREGFLPFFLGGSAEAQAGAELSARTSLPKANLCGTLSLSELAAFYKTLSLVVTPDTGPMHLADWLGVPVLNLSMGPVRAHETGPYSPGQYVLTPAMSCAGCWECRGAASRCRKKFRASDVCAFIVRLLLGEEPTVPARLRLWKSGRSDGIFCLQGNKLYPTDLVDHFWREVFLIFSERGEELRAKKAFQLLAESVPSLADHLALTLKNCIYTWIRLLRSGKTFSSNLLGEIPPHSRILAGFLEMYLQNGRYSQKTRSKACDWLAQLLALITSGP